MKGVNKRRVANYRKRPVHRKLKAGHHRGPHPWGGRGTREFRADLPTANDIAEFVERLDDGVTPRRHNGQVMTEAVL